MNPIDPLRPPETDFDAVPRLVVVPYAGPVYTTSVRLALVAVFALGVIVGILVAWAVR